MTAGIECGIPSTIPNIYLLLFSSRFDKELKIMNEIQSLL